MQGSVLIQAMQILFFGAFIYIFAALPFKCMEYQAKKYMSPEDFEENFTGSKVWFFGL